MMTASRCSPTRFAWPQASSGGAALVFLLTLALALLAFPVHAQSQAFPDQPAGLKDYGKPGVPRITVYLWGNADTGAWTVAEGTDLVEFLSVASRVPPNPRPDNRVIRTLKVFRDGYTNSDPFFEARLEEVFTQRSSYPELRNGDILLVEAQERRRFTWRDIAQVTGTVVGLLNTYLLIDSLGDN